MRILSLDISTKTGFSVHEGERLIEYGLLRVEIQDFNVQKDPNKSPSYPANLMNASKQMAYMIMEKVDKIQPDTVVIENTVKGRNRHTQRLLEWLHFCVLQEIMGSNRSFAYLDPSEWRNILEIRMSKEDKKNNRHVSQGKKRGKITKKHLSVRAANALYGLKLKIKDNDIADSICLGRAFIERSQNVKG